MHALGSDGLVVGSHTNPSQPSNPSKASAPSKPSDPLDTSELDDPSSLASRLASLMTPPSATVASAASLPASGAGPLTQGSWFVSKHVGLSHAGAASAALSAMPIEASVVDATRRKDRCAR